MAETLNENEFGLLALSGLAIFIVVERVTLKLKMAALAVGPSDERSAERHASTTYSACLNCGFHFSEVLPPTPATYPFNLISCPVCGQRLDGTGFRAGRAMTVEDRRIVLAQWLAHRGFDIATGDPHRDFGVDSFFEGEALPLPAAEDAPS